MAIAVFVGCLKTCVHAREQNVTAHIIIMEDMAALAEA